MFRLHLLTFNPFFQISRFQRDSFLSALSSVASGNY
jgi:hypothetical protein